MQNSDDRDNQQETGLVAWLAGIIDGEGTISLTVAERRGRGQTIRTHPKVVIGNTDPAIINGVFKALDVIGVGKYRRTDRPKPVSINGGPAYKMVTVVEVQGFKRVQKLLHAVGPWLMGEKKQRAEVLLAFIEGRMAECDAVGKASNMGYTKQDVDRAMTFLRLTRSKRLDHVAGILNEHTRSTPAHLA